MSIELRLSDATQIEDALALDVDAISLGSDGCPHKVPDADALRRARERVVSAGRQFKVVTPMVPRNHYDRMVNLIRDLAAWDLPLDIVVNDYGLLYGTQDVWGTSKLRPIAGITMSLSRSRIVHGNTIADGYVKGLTEAGRPKETIDLYKWIVEVTNQNSMQCRLRVDLLRDRFHVIGTEAVLAAAAIPSFTRIRDLGLQVSACAGRIIATISRACPTARYYKVSPPACAGRCNAVSTLTVREIAPMGVGAVLDAATEQKILDALPQFHVRGNVVLHEGLTEPDTVEAGVLNGVIFDVRDFARDELARLCTAWKNSGKVEQENRRCQN